MVVEITKETWEKCGIKTVKYHNEEKNVIELWHKMSHIETKLGHSNIDDVALKRIRKYCGKKTKDITKEEKEKYKAFFEGKEGVFIIEKLARDIIERCKLPKAIELREKSGYNHNSIMIREETSIAEKKILRLIKNLITENQIFGLKIIILLLKLMKEIMKIMTQMMKKKEKTCLKSIILKFFDVIQMILILIFLNF